MKTHDGNGPRNWDFYSTREVEGTRRQVVYLVKARDTKQADRILSDS